MISYQNALNILDKKDKIHYNEVEALLEEASTSYYNRDYLILSDLEYDNLYNKFKKLTGKEIISSLPEGKGLINVEHSYENLVGTLDKLFSFEEAEEWIKEIVSKFPNDEYNVRFTLKYDGNSVTLEFDENGKVKKALTRGRDGKGKDLTHVFKSNFNTNKKLNSEYAIKYEAIINYENYEKICNKYDEDYANPRSLISGILGRDNAKSYKDYITLVPLKLKMKEGKLNSLLSDDPEADFFREVYGDDCYYTKYYSNITAFSSISIIRSLKSFYNDVIKDRLNLPFMIDGIVITFLNKNIQSLGYTSVSSGSKPRFEKALKLPYLEKKN